MLKLLTTVVAFVHLSSMQSGSFPLGVNGEAHEILEDSGGSWDQICPM